MRAWFNWVMPQESKNEQFIHKLFIWGVLLKAVDGVLEVVGGIALFFTGALASIAGVLIQNELIEDPHDFIASHLQDSLPALLAHSGWFASMYLLSHGVIKIGLAAGLLRDKPWAYPTAIVTFALFIVYQLYRYTFTHSLFLMLLTLLDVVVIWLTWHEYQYFKKHHVFPA